MEALVIFDCDGVLVDSEIIVNQVHADELTRLGLPTTLSDALAHYCGMREPDMLEKIESQWGAKLPPGYSESIRKRVEQQYATSLRPVTGVVDALSGVRQRVCIASNSAPEKLELSLRVTNLFERFTPYIFSASSVRNPKPAPDLYLFAAERMGADPVNCVVIEDSALGVLAARAAGMTVIGFEGASHCLPGHGSRLIEHGACRSFGDMSELRRHIDEVLSA